MKGAPRKLRKSCSLPTCSKTPGECMHCTCDGRCGQHEGGHCGVRREGNGKSCKRDGCLRDDSCLHSTRATCCHCRNLVSSSNRSSRKRTRSAVSPVTADELLAVTAPAVLQKLPSSMVEGGDAGNAQDEDDDGATSPTSCDALVPVAPTDTFADFDLCDEILCKKRKLSEEQPQPMLPSSSSTTTVAAPPSPPPTTTTSTTDTPLKPLCEQDAYIARRATCNLIVLVDGVQFNLHKYPMLLESQVLNAKAREVVLSSKASVPVLQLNSFPGGPAVFDLLCVYAYTGHLHLDATTSAATLAGLHYLNMGLGAKTQTQTFISELMQSATTLDRLLQVTQHAAEIAETHDVAQPLLMDCIEAVARVLPLQLESIGSIVTLSSELFLHITQEMLATRGTSEVVGDAVRQLCVQAELAQIQRDAGADATARVLALLTQSLATATPTVGRVDAPQGEVAAVDDDDDDALFMKMMYDDFELEPASDVDADGNFADVLALEPFAFVGPRAPRTLAQAFAV